MLSSVPHPLRPSQTTRPGPVARPTSGLASTTVISGPVFARSRLNRRHCLQAAGALLTLAATTARPTLAQGAPAAPAAPPGTPLLTVRGLVRGRGAGVPVAFDMAALAALPQHDLRTSTPWYPQPRKFTGPLLREVLRAAGAHGTRLRLHALNDYHADMPLDDALRHDVVLGRLLDDRPLAVRDKGPLFVVYPFDSDASLRQVIYYSRSVWQLRTIEVL